MDFSFPQYCKCHACGGPIHFKSVLSVVVCPCCNTENHPPAGANTPVAAAQPRFPRHTCPCCGNQTFCTGPDGAILCEACGTQLPLTGKSAERKFNCSACHWELPIRGKQRVITCPACGMLNTMPDPAEEPSNPFLHRDSDFEI